jgi:hypothetical protein
MRYAGPSDADKVLDYALDEYRLPFRCPTHGLRPFSISGQMSGEWHSRFCDVEYGCGCKRYGTMYELHTTTAH